MQKRVEDAPKLCSNCQGNDLRWHVGTHNGSGVVDGRLRSHDLSVQFYLGCEECSETLMTVYADDFMDKFNEDVTVNYEDVTGAIASFGMTMIPGLVAVIARAVVRVGCFNTLEGAGRYFMAAIEKEAELKKLGEEDGERHRRDDDSRGKKLA